MTDLQLTQLNQYSNGTENIYRDRLTRIKYSEGVKYIAENGYSWFITDAMAVIKLTQKVRAEPFLTVKLILQPSNKAVLTIDDGGKDSNPPKVLYRQYYDWTDAKVNFTLVYENDLLMLPSER